MRPAIVCAGIVPNPIAERVYRFLLSTPVRAGLPTVKAAGVREGLRVYSQAGSIPARWPRFGEGARVQIPTQGKP